MDAFSGANESILEIKDVSLNFGGVQALKQVNAAVKEHEILVIIGPNGAGTTSILNCISSPLWIKSYSMKRWSFAMP